MPTLEAKTRHLKKRSILLLMAGVWAIAHDVHGTGDSDAWYLGVWQGRMSSSASHESNSGSLPNESLQVELKLDTSFGGRRIGRSNYPEVDCNGGLLLVEATEGLVRLFEKTFCGQCVPGEIHLSFIDEDTIRYRRITRRAGLLGLKNDISGPMQEVATGTLHRGAKLPKGLDFETRMTLYLWVTYGGPVGLIALALFLLRKTVSLWMMALSAILLYALSIGSGILWEEYVDTKVAQCYFLIMPGELSDGQLVAGLIAPLFYCFIFAMRHRFLALFTRFGGLDQRVASVDVSQLLDEGGQTEPYIINGKHVRFAITSGEVMGSAKRSETHVYSTGGGGDIGPEGGRIDAPTIGSIVTTKHEFWLQTEQGNEVPVQLSAVDIPLRRGQFVTMISTSSIDNGRWVWVLLVNHNAGKYWKIRGAKDVLRRLGIASPVGCGSLLLGPGVFLGIIFFTSNFMGLSQGASAVVAGVVACGIAIPALIVASLKWSRAIRGIESCLGAIGQCVLARR